MEKAIVELKGVSKVYDDGFVALKDIDLTLNQGAVYTLLGPSGSGTAPTLRAIAPFPQVRRGYWLIDCTRFTSILAHKRPLPPPSQEPHPFPA
ncbi:ATP-binding cassette domain-containing protein, partial [Enterobacter quasiroggenkampii]|uniref:ATP-binding cassette domain-containing protein n=1 Tax=Enterobacter quasiroggenkampii TaxID=2497436 RepID=UPI0034D1BE06|nr:hypothetical protein [Enterobacter quasiroggenkampii]